MPHAMSGIDNVGAGVTNEKQFIDYTSFNKVSRIRQGLNENSITKAYDIFYGLDEQRIKTIYDDFSTSGHIKTRYYFGSYEKEIDEFGNVTHIDYIYSPTGLTLIVKNGTQYYTHTDLLGSIERVTNATGNLVSEYTYTPWGGRILLGGVNITDRGYTGHEHLSPFGDDTNGGFCLINMNGRIYDPVLARFLSPDPYMQAPNFTQSFNRYAYCFNNPLIYTDPSGEIIFTIIGALLAPVTGGASLAIGIGMDIGMWSGGTIANGTANPFQWDYSSGKTWGYMAGGALIGGLSAGAGSAVTSSVGTALSFQGGGLIATGLGGATAGAIGGAGFSALAGGDPLEGAWKGALSGLAGGLVGGYISGGAGAFFGGATSGGVNAVLNGGDLEDIGKAALFGGAVSWGAYQVNSFVNYKTSGTTSLTKRQFDAMSRAAQKSFTRGREYGGWLTSDGKVEMWAKGSRAGLTPTAKPANANGFFHTHPNQGGGWVEMHSPQDISYNNGYAKVDSYVIGRQNVYLQRSMQASLMLSSNRYYNPYPFNTYFFYPFW
ncbi:MAG: RHS repeat-associated core domain-containing protein [Paludibacter sp.]|nr:RHS repeat-associated core domain-containing protein [Paludibacter sp.]